MKKIRVLIVACNDLNLGGIQSVILSIIRSMHEDICFDLISFSKGEDFYDREIESYGCHIYRIPDKGEQGSFSRRLDYYVRGSRRYRKTLKIINEYGPYDAIHCNNYEEAGVILKAAYKAGIPIRISHSHNCMPPLKKKYIRKLYRAIYKELLLKYSTHMIACSNAAGEYLFGKNINFHVIENAIDINGFNIKELSHEKLWTFINIGRWGSQKNQLFLIDVFARIVERHNEAKLSLVGYGDDAYLNAIEKKISEYGISDNVLFYPGDSDIPGLLEKNNVFLFPSTFEGLGIVLIEAQACALKCFASTSVPGEANLGYVEYLPLDADVWAQTVNDHIETNGARRYPVNMGSYDIQNISNKYRTLYSGGELQ